jgi:hypothetical protein
MSPIASPSDTLTPRFDLVRVDFVLPARSARGGLTSTQEMA